MDRNDETLPDGDRWVCAFCGRLATLETSPRTLCESRTCSCGAIALANRPCDFDEITDDAIRLFAVPIRPESCGYDLAARLDILRSGVEMRPGVVCEVELFPGQPEQLHHIWFRRSDGARRTESVGPQQEALVAAEAELGEQAVRNAADPQLLHSLWAPGRPV